ncbi:hypothetical protein N9L26_00845 [Candidatus Pacebacteria bacterium]|nr:hypothetical protein [Candidatus Paceibacterota bacterium]
MKQFLIIYGMPSNAMAKMKEMMNEEEMAKGMQEWQAWQDANQDHMVELGNPVGKNSRVNAEGATEHSNEIGGYSIMQGESKEAVVEVVKSNPHFKVPGGYIEVMEIINR